MPTSLPDTHLLVVRAAAQLTGEVARHQSVVLTFSGGRGDTRESSESASALGLVSREGFGFGRYLHMCGYRAEGEGYGVLEPRAYAAVVAASIPEPSRTGPLWGMASPVVYSYAAALVQAVFIEPLSY